MLVFMEHFVWEKMCSNLNDETPFSSRELAGFPNLCFSCSAAGVKPEGHTENHDVIDMR